MRDAADSPHLMRGLLLRERGRYADAAQCFHEALTEDPHNATALAELAICQANLPAEAPRAQDTIARAIALDADNAGLYVVKAAILADQQEPQAALVAADEALARDSTLAGAFSAKAHALLALKRWPEAEAAARAALKLDADVTFAANLLAHALQMQKKRDEQAAHLAGMLARNPEDALTHANAGWAALERGDREAAHRHFREALRLQPNMELARRGIVEAYKAKSPVYRAFIAYSMFMQRLRARSQMALIFGLFAAVVIAPRVFAGRFAMVGTAVVYVYFLFVLWTWVAPGIGNFILLFHRFARHALRPLEKLEAVTVGGSVCVGLPLFAVGLALGSGAAGLMGVLLLSCAIPFAAAFTSPNPRGLYLYGAIGVVVFAITCTIAVALVAPIMSGATAGTLLSVGRYLVLGTTVLVVTGFLRR